MMLKLLLKGGMAGIHLPEEGLALLSAIAGAHPAFYTTNSDDKAAGT
jgi:hypothetical protein